MLRTLDRYGRPFELWLHCLTMFAGLVTGLFWAFGLGLAAAAGGETTWTGSIGYLGAVLFFWMASVLPSLVLAAVHLLFVWVLRHRVSPRGLRLASTGAALCMVSVVFADAYFRPHRLAVGVPLVALLTLYGWTAAGIVQEGRAASRLDRSVSWVGLGVAVALVGSLACFAAYAWRKALL